MPKNLTKNSKQLTKKTRFEVFKRDSFQCQYCGKTPPEITLEIDHINPKSKGGSNDINNLITACFDCNRGKKNIPLDKIPVSLKVNLEVLKEQEVQLKEYNKFIKKIETRRRKDAKEVNDVYEKHFSDWTLSNTFINISLKKFQQHLPLQFLVDAMGKSCVIMRDKDKAINYFCGICWKEIKK